MNNTFVSAGEARIANVELSAAALKRSARIARCMVRLHTEQKWQIPIFASHDYAGRYLPEDNQRIPEYHAQLIAELDTLIPPELTEISVLRERYRSKRNRELMHVDTVRDYRTITVLSGEGEFRTLKGSGTLEDSQTLPLERGSVVEMNNFASDASERLWHRAEGSMLLLVYGKYSGRTLTWHS